MFRYRRLGQQQRARNLANRAVLEPEQIEDATPVGFCHDVERRCHTGEYTN